MSTSWRSAVGSTQLMRRSSRSIMAEVSMCFSTKLRNLSFFLKNEITCGNGSLHQLPVGHATPSQLPHNSPTPLSQFPHSSLTVPLQLSPNSLATPLKHTHSSPTTPLQLPQNSLSTPGTSPCVSQPLTLGWELSREQGNNFYSKATPNQIFSANFSPLCATEKAKAVEINGAGEFSFPLKLPTRQHLKPQFLLGCEHS